MPLAKTAVQTQVSPTSVMTSTDVKSLFVYENIPIDIGRYFQVDLFSAENKVKKQLTDIYEWSRLGNEEDTIGNSLQKISKLDSNLGTRVQDRTKLDRIWNWVILDKQIKELRKRQSVYEG